MPITDEEIDLFRAILHENCANDMAARKHLNEAARLDVDPLDYCAHRFGLGNQAVWRRAAHWASLPFAVTTPTRLPLTRVSRIDHLGEVRTLRQPVLGADTVFVAPRFANIARLRAAPPDVRDHVRIVSPDAIEAALARAASDQLIDGAQAGTARLWPQASAARNLPLTSRLAFVLLLALLIVTVMVTGFVARWLFVPLAALLLLAPSLLRILAAAPRPSMPKAALLSDEELPVYTILIPLRDEAAMVPMLQRAMQTLDYPSEKLDVKFVVESRSPQTIAAVRSVLDDPRFRLVEVPDCMPRTKPKAIDYALPLARGEHLVVFDAEDVPDPDQLRLAASHFASDPTLAVLQAELVPENASENALTALFAGEYAGLFGRLLPALARWELPVPLGGTSNHFRTDVLRELGGWDAFNVTEDADLGVRLARRRLRAATFESRTLEEAPLTVSAWMAQRTRWMKGWMQTFIVHNQAPVQFARQAGWRAFFGFQVLMGGMILTSLLHTVFVLTLLWRLATDGAIGLVPRDPVDWLSAAILLSGYAAAFAIQVSGLMHQRAYHLLPMQLLLPLYWFLHTAAAMRAAWQLIAKPMYWAKTTHGMTRLSRGRSPAASVLPARSGRVAAEVEI